MLRYRNTFNSAKFLASHHEYCKSYEAIKIELSEEGWKISFKNHYRSMRFPFIESFTPQLSTCHPNSEKSYTKQCQKHTTSGFGYHIKCFDDTLYSQQPVTFVQEFNDDDVAQIFIDTLEKNIKEIYEKFKFPKSMIMIMHDKLVYDNSTLRHICNAELGKDKVRAHCHLSDEFRGAAHEVCNLKYKIPKCFPVVFHNLSGYDSHLFIRTLGNSEGDISCIPNNKEINISFTKEIIVDKFVNKQEKEINAKMRVKIYRQLEIYGFEY